MPNTEGSLKGGAYRFVHAVLAISALLTSGLCGIGAFAQSYPTRPIKLVVPFPAGGPADVLGRVITQKLSESFGRPVIIDNRSGANGIIGTDLVAKAMPDGYTMLIALAKQKPGQISFSSSGNGSALQLAGELFSAIAGVKLVHVPYKGAGPAFNDLLSGQVQLMFPATVSVMPYVNSGRLRVLAQTGATREPGLPNVPTLMEEGFGDFNITGWFGIWVPARTPDGIVRRLHAEIARALKLPDVRERFDALGVSPSGVSPEEFGKFVHEDYERIGKYVKQADIRLD